MLHGGPVGTIESIANTLNRYAQLINVALFASLIGLFHRASNAAKVASEEKNAALLAQRDQRIAGLEQQLALCHERTQTVQSHVALLQDKMPAQLQDSMMAIRSGLDARIQQLEAELGAGAETGDLAPENEQDLRRKLETASLYAEQLTEEQIRSAARTAHAATSASAMFDIVPDELLSIGHVRDRREQG
jgi:hypothetical protein